MTTASNNSELAVIGDDVLVDGLKLAGVKRCFSVSAVQACDIGEEVRKIVVRLLEERKVSIIVILDKYVPYVLDLLDGVRQSKRITPVIVEIPAIREIDYEAVKEYYKRLARKHIGFELEI